MRATPLKGSALSPLLSPVFLPVFSPVFSTSALLSLSALLAFLPLPLAAQTGSPEQITVVGVVPGGAGIDRVKVPYPIQSAGADELAQASNASLADFLRRGFGSVSLNDAQNNPLQPDLQLSLIHI